MSSASRVNQFKSMFLSANGGERFQLLQRISQINADTTQIGNLLQTVNVNDTSIQNKHRSDNIHFVCAQLLAFPNFRL